MGTAGRSAPLRRTGSLLGLLGLELAAVVGLHWLGRVEGLRIGWDRPVPWLLSSPVQDVLGAVLRTVGLVMAYWLLVSTLLYLLASLTRLPAAVRAVRWATLPGVRRVADHAVAVTLATSMVGGGTIGVAGPALAADRGRAGPPARKPVAALTASPAAQDDTTTTVYSPRVAGPPDDTDQATEPSRDESTSSSETTTTTAAPATAAPTTAPPTTAASTTTPPTTAPSTTAPPTTNPTTTRPPTTTATTRRPTTTRPPAYVPAPASRPSGKESAATTTAPTTTTPPSSTTSGTGPGPHVYRFPAAGPPSTAKKELPTPPPSSSRGGETSTSGGGPGGRQESEPGDQAKRDKRSPHWVKRGENLWTIARDALAKASSGGPGEPTNREVFRYWLRVVKENRKHLESKDPDLIYPQEKITLPPPPVD